MTTTNITAREMELVVAETELANNAWMRGDASAYGELNADTEDYTIMGPFGGPTTKGYRVWAERAPNIAKDFQRGASSLRVIQSYASGDLLVLVLDEQQHGELGGGPDQPWSLRVTQVYRREGDRWKVVHRHADPLARRRSLHESAALARE
jgi:ketosteroid isomerase-like protein